MVRKFLLAAALLLGAALAALLLPPSPIDAVAWTPPPKPGLVGPYAPNDALHAATLLGRGEVDGPEDIAVDAQGRVYAGTADGRIVRLDEEGHPRTFATTGGRPLGLAFDAAGHLLVADAWKGLLSVDPAGVVTVLSTAAAGVPFAFTDNLAVARDGGVYFSDASDKYHQPDYVLDGLEARPHGRLLKYDPATKQTTVLLADLYFANGVALDQDERFVLVTETYRYRIRRLWLKGEQAGTTDVFLDDLPGFPDNLHRGPRGTYWLALFTVRNDVLDTVHPHPWLKGVLAKLPKPLQPKPAKYGFVVEIDAAGRVLRSLQDPSGEPIRIVTTALEHDGVLWLGSLHERWIGRLPLPR